MLEKQILILASSSPRRLALLGDIGVSPSKTISPNINEQPLLKEKPDQLSLRLSEKKAMEVVSSCKDNMFILAADTIVGTKSKIFDKANTRQDVEKYLDFFSGRRIAVYTSVSVIKLKNGIVERVAKKLVSSDIKFKRFNSEEIQCYLDSNKGIGMAGGFSIQGGGESLVKRISGSYSAIVGLPLYETVNLLNGIGYHVYNQGSR